MFDLNEQINKWRRKLSQSDTLQKSDVDELEGHLREEIERLTAVKLSDQEAFYVARHRLGDATALTGEFAKVNTAVIWRKRLFWAGLTMLAWFLITYTAGAASQTCVLLAGLAGIHGYALNVVDILSQMTVFLGAVFALYRIAKRQDMRGDLFCRIADRPWGKPALFATVVLVLISMLATRAFVVTETVKLLSAQEFGMLALLKSLKGLVYTVSAPLALLIAVILLRPSRLKEAPA